MKLLPFFFFFVFNTLNSVNKINNQEHVYFKRRILHKEYIFSKRKLVLVKIRNFDNHLANKILKAPKIIINSRNHNQLQILDLINI